MTPIRKAKGGISANSEGGSIDVGEEEREEPASDKDESDCEEKTKRTEGGKDSCWWLDENVIRERRRKEEIDGE